MQFELLAALGKRCGSESLPQPERKPVTGFVFQSRSSAPEVSS
jgi:hypothetical protein